METAFWLCLGLLAYVYAGYPLCVFALARLFPARTLRGEPTPLVSVIVSAYNEERHLAAKLAGLLRLDYPPDRLEIIVGSDGSTDATNDIARGFAPQGVRLLAFERNRGKTAVQNDCVRQAAGEVLVFMDAASFNPPEALKALVAKFADPCVGAVAGRIVYRESSGHLVGQGQTTYWSYEDFLKRQESRLGSLIGVDGPLYAVRSELYVPLGTEVITDLITPLLVSAAGYRVVYEPAAIAYEEATATSGQEFRTRRRVVARGILGLLRHPDLLNPLRHPLLAFQIVSHKVLRWLAGVFFAGLVLASCALRDQLFYGAVFYVLLGFCLLALTGWLAPRGRCAWLCLIPYYFLLVNVSAVCGLGDTLLGKHFVSWQPVRTP